MRFAAVSAVILLLLCSIYSVWARQSSPQDIQDSLQERQLGGLGLLKPTPKSYVSSYEIIETFPHDHSAFTQGLTFDDNGTLYESDGLYGKSMVRAVEVKSGSSLRSTPNSKHLFGEGIEVVGDKLLQLSWRENTLTEFQLDSLQKLRSVPVRIGREGWGLTYDGQHLLITDSTDYLYRVDLNYKIREKLKIVDPRLKAGSGKSILGVNELEMVEGELWGNVLPLYQGKSSECIVRIDPASGEVLGWIDMRGLLAQQRSEVQRDSHSYVLNGIAYHEETGRLYVTGKQWDKMYHIRVVEQPELGPEHIHKVCSLG